MANFLTGSPGKFRQLNRFGPQAMGVQNLGIQNLMQMLQSGAGSRPDTSGFQPIAQQARANFAQQGLPSLAERFQSLGGYGGSAFNRFASGAQANLERDLAAQEAQFGQQQQGLQQQLLQLLIGLGLTPSFENVYEQGQPGLLQPLFGGLGQGFGAYLGSGGNPFSGLAGLFGGFGKGSAPATGGTPPAGVK